MCESILVAIGFVFLVICGILLLILGLLLISSLLWWKVLLGIVIVSSICGLLSLGME